MANATAGIGAMIAIMCAASPSVAAPSKAVSQLGSAYRAYAAGDYERAYDTARKIPYSRLRNADYGVFVLAQSASLTGRHAVALRSFERLARMTSSRFSHRAAWRAADTLWSMGRISAATSRYRRLLRSKRRDGDGGVARFRIAEADARAGRTKRAISGFREVRNRHPGHPLAKRAATRIAALAGPSALAMTAPQRVDRARLLVLAHKWRDALAELALVDDRAPQQVRDRRDYWRGMAMFKLRRQYKRAADILLKIYSRLDSQLAPKALFHGARALSRADFDKEAIRYYQRVVSRYPRSVWAQEAQYLSGWLEYNMGNFDLAIPHLVRMRKLYPKSRWSREALWFLGFSYYMAGKYAQALPLFAKLSKHSGRLRGGKGRYWHARTLQKLGKHKRAEGELEVVIQRAPFSWYALLARARLAERGIQVTPFGKAPGSPARAPAIDTQIDKRLAKDPLIASGDELMAAGLDVEAGYELHRGERAFLRRTKPRSAGLAILMDRYRKAGNFNRPWMMSIVYGGRRALNLPPKGKARVWWQHAYPKAYEGLIDKWGALGNNIPYYLYSIMRKESGYNPHVHSYANARGLVQMIPRTTKKVVKELGIPYTEDMLYDPELNIKTGSWYIGRLLHKFKRQIPYGAGSYNCGPRPVMRWMRKNGKRPADEFVELVSYTQTREYMKMVTETYARYLYLYEGKVYDQPLRVDADYVVDDLTY